MNQNLLRLSVYFVIIFTSQFIFAAAEFPGCECPKVECDPCYEEQGMKFYSEKCGEEGSRVRSCAKPTCSLMDPLPGSCEHAKKEQESRNPATVTAASAPVEVKLPPVEQKQIRGPLVAEVKAVSGTAWVKPIDGKRESLIKGSKVHEKDSIITDAKSFLKLQFFDGNEVSMTEKSEMSLDTYENNMSDKKRALLKLLKGRLRSHVTQKYDGKTTYFRVKTPIALAGVRGTDFVVTYQAGEKLVTEVSTFEGEVKFQGNEAPEADALAVTGGEQMSFVVAANSSDVFSPEEMQTFISKGYMTPVYKMTAPEISKLETDTGGKNRATASDGEARNESPACNEPTAKFNQCRWSCENNPKDSDRCRTDLPEVHCVRKRCDAGGKWSDESRLPASFYEACEPQEVRVGPCDY